MFLIEISLTFVRNIHFDKHLALDQIFASLLTLGLETRLNEHITCTTV